MIQAYPGSPTSINCRNAEQPSFLGKSRCIGSRYNSTNQTSGVPDNHHRLKKKSARVTYLVATPHSPLLRVSGCIRGLCAGGGPQQGNIPRMNGWKLKESAEFRFKESPRLGDGLVGVTCAMMLICLRSRSRENGNRWKQIYYIPRFLIVSLCFILLIYSIIFTMFLSFKQVVWLLLPVLAQGATVNYTIPASAPSGAATLDPAPVGVS